jgi:CBS domain-containing protein
MLVKKIMSRKVSRVAPTLSLQKAAQKMKSLDVGCLPVDKNGRLVGIITDRDITCRAVAKGSIPAKTTVGQAMSKSISYCFDDQNVAAAARIMEKKQLRRLPVLDRKKKHMVGILSFGDLALHVPRQLTGEVAKAVARPT